MVKLAIAIGFVILFIAVMALLRKNPNYNCSDFFNYSEAVAVFKSTPTDIYGLDRDKDKKPCEELL